MLQPALHCNGLYRKAWWQPGCRWGWMEGPMWLWFRTHHRPIMLCDKNERTVYARAANVKYEV